MLHSHDEDAGPDEPKFFNCSWATVFNQIVAAKEGRSAQGDTSAAKLLGIEIVSQYVDLIPQDHGLGVIKGTLGLIFAVST